MSEISNAIKQLKCKRAVGQDYSYNEFFINGKDTLLPVLHGLFNKTFDIGYFPQIIV